MQLILPLPQVIIIKQSKSNIIRVMSLDQIRKLRLMKDLQRSPHASPKNELKRRTLTSNSMTENLRKINKNKKYMIEEERNTEIQRNNRILYEKIVGHFQQLKQTTQSRNKWRKKKRKVQLMTNEEQSFHSSKLEQKEPYKFRSRVETIRDSKVEQFQTLFLGKAEIDEIALKTKLSLSKQRYILLANNPQLSIELEMEHDEYMKLHRGALAGNPCNIFRYLTIKGRKVQFREEPRGRLGKSKTLV